MTCPHCGARNTETAPWCTQCLAPLRDTAPRPAPADDDAPPPASRAAPPTTPAPPRPTPPSDAGVDRAFRSIDGEVQWRCPTCDTWHPLAVVTCRVCGQALASSVTGAATTQVTERVGRARRWLWTAAAVGGVLMVVSVVLLVLALRSGATG